jgi:hypothetical protein
MKPHIRPIIDTDVNQLIDLNNQFIPAVNQLTTDLFKELLADAQYSLSLILDDLPIGFLLALPPGCSYDSKNYVWFDSRYDDFLYIDRIVIGKSHHHYGLGIMLYDELRALNNGEYRRFSCEVNIKPLNEPSIRFHQRYGFQCVGTQTTEHGAKHVMLMEYEIGYST